jgi:hypothetical protein
MKATKTYAEVTARTIGPKLHDWINELVERFGDDEVSAALLAEGAAGCPPEKLLGKRRDRLASGAARRRASQPTHVEQDWFLAIVRGEATPPDGLDVRDPEQHATVQDLGWVNHRMGMARPGEIPRS